MPSPEKKAIVAELREAIEDSQSIYLTEFHHLNVSEMNELRGRILDNDAYLQVTKNRLLKLALADTDAQELIEFLSGPTAVAFCQGDPIAIAKVISEFGETHEYIVINAGIVDGRLFDAEEARSLAKLPPRDRLLAELLASIGAPTSGLVNLVDNVVSQFVFVLEAIADKRKEQEE